MKYLTYTLVLLVVLVVSFGLFFNQVIADNGGGVTGGEDNGGGVTGGGVTLDNPAGSDTIEGLVHNITSALVIIATPIVAIMILIGAFQILFAAGDPEKFKRGKKTILYTVIGYAIILVASGITSIINNVLSAGGN